MLPILATPLGKSPVARGPTTPRPGDYPRLGEKLLAPQEDRIGGRWICRSSRSHPSSHPRALARTCLPRGRAGHTIGYSFFLVNLREPKKQIQYTIVPRSRISKQSVIELNNLTKEAVPQILLKKVAQSVLRQEKQKGARLSIVLLEKKRMLQLNRTYKKKNRVANVLSFPFNDVQAVRGSEEPSGSRRGKPIPELGLGEVVLCPAEIRKNAKEYGISYTRAMVWMLIHGILHVLGYTHTQMVKKEKIYRSRIS